MTPKDEVARAISIPLNAPVEITIKNSLTIPEECAFDRIVRDYNCNDAVSLVASRGIVRWFRSFPVRNDVPEKTTE